MGYQWSAVESCCGAAAQSTIACIKQAIYEVCGRLFPKVHCILNRWLLLKGQIAGSQQCRESREDTVLWQIVSTSQHPFHFHQDRQAYQDCLALAHRARDQSTRLLELESVGSDQVPHENVRVYSQHQRDGSWTGTGFRSILRNNAAITSRRLVFNRMTTTPSGINVKIILSPAFMRNSSRMLLGIVI
jgi:hypothetical protein